jgi:ABC-type Na+ efflux pump permease subunit
MKLSTLFVLIPVVLIAAVLAVANREDVVFRLDPFAANDSAVVFVMPLFLLVFLSFLVGVLVGAATIALRRGRNARRKRLAASDVSNVPMTDAVRREEPKA